MLGASDPEVFALLRPPANFWQSFGLRHAMLRLRLDMFGLPHATSGLRDETLRQEAVDDAGDIVEGDEEEQADDEHDADLLDRLHDARVDRAAADGFDAEEHQLAAVEDGEREQIEDREVDADHRGDVEQIRKADIGSGGDDIGDHHWAAEEFRTEAAGEELMEDRSEERRVGKECRL